MSKIREECTTADEILDNILTNFEKGVYARLIAGKSLIFWSDDFESSTKTHFGNKTASEYNIQEARLSKTEALMIKPIEDMSEGQVVLHDEGENALYLSLEDKRKIGALNSAAFAMSAKGTVICSTKGSAPQSYFRKVEFDIIMNNPEVTEILTIDRDHPGGKKLLPKMDAGHIMRDEWVEDALTTLSALTTQYNELAAHALEGPIIRARRDALSTAAEEMLLAERMSKADFPFRANQLMSSDSALLKYSYQDHARERARVDKIQATIAQLGLEEEFESILAEKRAQPPETDLVDMVITEIKIKNPRSVVLSEAAELIPGETSPSTKSFVSRLEESTNKGGTSITR